MSLTFEQCEALWILGMDLHHAGDAEDRQAATAIWLAIRHFGPKEF